MSRTATDWADLLAMLCAREGVAGDDVRFVGEGYVITREGEVYSLRSGRPHRMRPWRDGAGYPSVGLGRRKVGIHVLMLEAFVGPCPEGMEVRHLDDNPLNHRLDNLAYGTRSQNLDDRKRNGRAPRGLSAEQADEARRLVRAGMSNSAAARHFGVVPSTVWKAVNRAA